MKTAIILSIFFLVVGGCDNSLNKDEQDLFFQRIAVAETNNPTIPIVAAHEGGDVMAVLSNSDGTRVEGAVFINNRNRSFTVFVDKNGFPERAYSEGYVLLYENYRGNRVDVAVVDPTGQVELVRDISINSNISLAKQYQELNKQLSMESIDFHQFAQFAATTLTIAGCVAGIATGAGAVPLAIPCGAAILNIIANYSQSDHPAVEASSTAIGVAAGAIGCATAEPFSCASLIAEIAAAISGAAESEIESRQEEIASAIGALRFGGVWIRTDVNDTWFVIDVDYAADVFYRSSGCYDFVRGTFISYSGNTFSYRTEDGRIVDLNYTLSGNGNMLNIVRPSDGASWVLDHGNQSITSLSPECSSLLYQYSKSPDEKGII